MDDLKLHTPDFIFEASGTGVIMTRVADGRWVAGISAVAAVYSKMLKVADLTFCRGPDRDRCLQYTVATPLQRPSPHPATA